MYEIIYFSPHYDPNMNSRILKMLEEVSRLTGIKWREIVVSKPPLWNYKPIEMTEKEAYDTYLKPATREIRSCLEVLSQMGMNVRVDSASRKFRSRRGNYRVSGSLVLLKHGRVICALNWLEISEFLEWLLYNGTEILDNITRINTEGFPSILSESGVITEYIKILRDHGYKVFRNVTGNLGTSKKLIFQFQPDADIIAVKGNTVLGFEAKGLRREGMSLSQIYIGLGEALFYLINPLYFEYDNIRYRGGIFDKVYLLLPYAPSDNSILELLHNLGVIGLVTLREGIIIDPEPNPHLNHKKKAIFLRNLEMLRKYI